MFKNITVIRKDGVTLTNVGSVNSVNSPTFTDTNGLQVYTIPLDPSLTADFTGMLVFFFDATLSTQMTTTDIPFKYFGGAMPCSTQGEIYFRTKPMNSAI